MTNIKKNCVLVLGSNGDVVLYMVVDVNVSMK
jgi:hypothetical protein